MTISKNDLKFINHQTIINKGFREHGLNYFKSQEFDLMTTVSSNTSAEDVLQFIFVVAYEVKDFNPDIVYDNTGIVSMLLNKLLQLDNYLNLSNTDILCLRKMSAAFLHLYYVFDNKDRWKQYSRQNGVVGPKLLEAIETSMERLRLALLEINNVPIPNNIIYRNMISNEIKRICSMLSNHFVIDGNEETVDISSVFLFADQLDNPSFFNELAKQVYTYIVYSYKQGATFN